MNIDPLFTYINRFVDLTEEEKGILASQVTVRKYLKNQFIVQQGDVCRFENFVLSGCARAFHVDNEGQEHIVMLAIENWWISDLGSYLSQTPAFYNVQCLEATEVVQFPFENLELLYEKIPKLERFFRIIIQKAFVSSEKRIVRNLSLSAKDRYLEFRKQYPAIEQRVPQYMIASYLGMTKEFLSKVRSQLISDQ
ncbi:MAG TPA: Crp/Fnr family transcriptional regulator [Cyclobacteriaceae bacterium]|nr:Crp/Fnr family transcriptional regulator [Cyclobacteriaceae bacterium]